MKRWSSSGLLTDLYQLTMAYGYWKAGIHERRSDLLGIRLDSGNLANLSKQARQLLDEAGFNQTKIVAILDAKWFGHAQACFGQYISYSK